MLAEQILPMLAGCSGQKPMAFNTLLVNTGMQPDALEAALEALYDQRKINRAMHTKDGVSQWNVWPTGVLAFLPYGRKTERVAPTPPRRDETKVTLTKIEEPYMTTEKTEEKSRTLRVLEYIEANPGCRNKEMEIALGFSSPTSYLTDHVKRGKVIRTFKSRGGAYQLAEGLTAAEIYSGGYNKYWSRRKVAASDHELLSAAAPAGVLEINHKKTGKPLPVVQACRAQDREMLRTEAGIEMVKKAALTLESLDEKIGSIELDASLLKFAYTTDKTLLLMGLTEKPIELSAAQTDDLIEFCVKLDFVNSEEFSLA
jgi:hypothetical protein